jgi:dipeptidyl-peptidase 4
MEIYLSCTKPPNCPLTITVNNCISMKQTLNFTFICILLIPVVLVSCASTSEMPSELSSEATSRSPGVVGVPGVQNQMPTERYDRAARLLSFNLNSKIYRNNIRPEWITSQALWYEVNTEKGDEYMLVNLAEKRKEPLFDQVELARQLNEGRNGNSSQRDGNEREDQDRMENEAENDRDTGVDPYDLPVTELEVSEDLATIRFRFDNRQWSLDRETGILTEGDKMPKNFSRQNLVLSPSGRYAAYIQDHNLRVTDLQTGEDIQLTTTGEEGYGFSTDSQGWSRSNRPVLAWSADESMISTYRLDERNVEMMHLLRTSENRPELISWPYALPGDENVPMHERYVISIPERKTVRLKTNPDHQRTSNCCGLTRGREWADNEFSPDGKTLAFISTSRDYKEVTLKLADTRTGEVRDVYTERDEYFIETNLTSRGVPNWRVLHDSNEFIWFSRSSNWGHLYLHDLASGDMKNAITNGEWNVIDILRVDEEGRRIWFTAAGMNADNDPYEDYLYSVGFDGNGLTSHTEESGNHSITLSPDAGLFVDSWSHVQIPNTTVIRDRDGSVIMELEKADITEVLASGWQAPEPFTVKARDGETDIYGLMIRPSDFDSSYSYPVINSIYPGPQTGSVGSRAFSVSRRGQAHALAELGFIVVLADAMGSPKRSREFHTAYYGDMADNGLPDQIAVMRQLADRHAWIDLERTGIYGHSGGGFATASALLNHPDFFKVGVAGAGNMDNRGYTFYWGEKFQGPMERYHEDDSYTNQALQLRAGNLKGKLLISYGTLDSNVHPNMTLLVINELIRENKDFDMFVMPNRGHGYGSESYTIRRTWDYFVTHLLGLKPPLEYEITR